MLEEGRSVMILRWGGQEERRGRGVEGGVVVGVVRVTEVGREEVWLPLRREGLVGRVSKRRGRSQRLHHLPEPEVSLSENRRF